ncbi:Scr1 family TA system antitoxin-like transcriptional regulator [Algirhabdus cladophorae]|uniref:Scr1 family TA system antitoxin-like transcriptional regulator n=1 Tax=Algirhabdus cladophorae TaxID=3377108 RepID=UPI003B84A4B1
MDRRDLSIAFRERFRALLSEVKDDLPQFLEQAQLDRSALSQLRDPKQDRLPRAETLRRIAQATGVSVDWLLALSNARSGRQELTQSSRLLSPSWQDGSSPLARWHAEAAGQKIRYVPAVLPDMLSLSVQPQGAKAQEKVLTGFDLEEVDLEIAMPFQTFDLMVGQRGRWQGSDATIIAQQIRHIADLCEQHYPALRLHLFDAKQFFCAPFTVFGRRRASIYVGEAYISVTGSDEVRYFSKRFDQLVRQAVVTPDAVPDYLQKIRE